MTVSDGFSPSPKGEAEPARPHSKSATVHISSHVILFFLRSDSLRYLNRIVSLVVSQLVHHSRTRKYSF